MDAEVLIDTEVLIDAELLAEVEALAEADLLSAIDAIVEVEALTDAEVLADLEVLPSLVSTNLPPSTVAVLPSLNVIVVLPLLETEIAVFKFLFSTSIALKFGLLCLIASLT